MVSAEVAWSHVSRLVTVVGRPLRAEPDLTRVGLSLVVVMLLLVIEEVPSNKSAVVVQPVVQYMVASKLKS